MSEMKSKSKTEELKESAYEKAPPPKKNIAKIAFSFILAGIVLFWAFTGAKFDIVELVKGAGPLTQMFGRMLPPDFHKIGDEKHYSKPEVISVPELILPIPLESEKARQKTMWWNNQFPQTIIGAMIQTIQMALTGTTIAMIFAFPLSFLAARNTSPHPLIYTGIRWVLSVLRTLPELAVGLVFVSAVGLGPFAGTLALAFATTTIITKLLSEAIENIDERVVEALKATGANYVQVLSFAVVPPILPT